MKQANKNFTFLIIGILLMLGRAEATDAPKPYNLEKGIAIQGYDPVSYQMAKGPMPGKKELAFKVGEATYLFSSQENLTSFQKDPAKYEPLYGGWCAYAMSKGNFVEVDPMSFKIVNGKLLLFYKDWFNNTLNKWNENETALRPKADEFWKSKFGEKK